jgi:hypothetical protein
MNFQEFLSGEEIKQSSVAANQQTPRSAPARFMTEGAR